MKVLLLSINPNLSQSFGLGNAKKTRTWSRFSRRPFHFLEAALVLIDTSGCGMFEAASGDEISKANEGEVALVTCFFRHRHLRFFFVCGHQ
jgi:hypothetical protein